jgi:D-beta-D-heptose 7-phosphate kinase/D-beta-D-heptose 1-phosphate adenosyltransferase
VTGGFDPLHSGHIEYFKAAKELGDILIVGLNSDEWLKRKKGRAFMPYQEREAIVFNLKFVDSVYSFDDSDGSAIEFIKSIIKKYPNDKIIFVNGGDRTQENIPEMCFDDVEFIFGVGGFNKKNSSSKIVKEYKFNKTNRPWGHYSVLDESSKVKIKQLVISPNGKMSMQKHSKRSELWFICEGSCMVNLDNSSKKLEHHQYYHVNKNDWHQLFNPFEEECKIIEIQYGEKCIEEDIERK